MLPRFRDVVAPSPGASGAFDPSGHRPSAMPPAFPVARAAIWKRSQALQTSVSLLQACRYLASADADIRASAVSDSSRSTVPVLCSSSSSTWSIAIESRSSPALPSRVSGPISTGFVVCAWAVSTSMTMSRSAVGLRSLGSWAVNACTSKVGYWEQPGHGVVRSKPAADGIRRGLSIGVGKAAQQLCIARPLASLHRRVRSDRSTHSSQVSGDKAAK